MKLNNKGEVSFLALMITIIFVTLTLYLYFSINSNIASVKRRSEDYLCLRYLTSQTEKIDRTLQSSNTRIIALNTAMGAAMAAGRVEIKEALKKTRTLELLRSNFLYANHFRKIMSSSQCNKKTRLKYFAPALYESKGPLLKRDFWKIAQRKEKWSFMVMGHDFNLYTTYKDKKWKVKEFSIKKVFNFFKSVFG